jgi:hypothetical protein
VVRLYSGPERTIDRQSKTLLFSTVAAQPEHRYRLLHSDRITVTSAHTYSDVLRTLQTGRPAMHAQPDPSQSQPVFLRRPEELQKRVRPRFDEEPLSTMSRLVPPLPRAISPPMVLIPREQTRDKPDRASPVPLATNEYDQPSPAPASQLAGHRPELDVEHLTDRVIERIEHRLTAQRERLGGR